MPELPDEVVSEARRLARLARDASEDAAADAYRDRLDELLAEHDRVARVRDADATLVCYPADWADDDGTVHPTDIEDPDRAEEVSLAGGGEQGDYADAAERNAELVERVADEYDDVHAENAAAFAAFMNNHYARPMDTATDAERAEFREEFFPRNAWPSDEQRALLDDSLDAVAAVAEDGDT
ncbi:DUF7108 family protein [Halobacterium jilantaiense]|uniref:RnhA operon protein n=1 Tax=Halobacterium jilantaiense TaxID=355548 RepID=A0A1I0P1Q8_9EURY|nr:rnhA operon protein [Halobacterium jilantaiense]SEW07399.1 hypothetical protein SAMN04487945_1282 [Halobacterium jilantaiense]